jgi:cell filamentation protein
MARHGRSDDYDAIADPYCYPRTAILRIVPGIRDAATLAQFEAISTAQRADEPLPAGRLSVRHYCAIHHHLFRDVYTWAGKFRTVRLSKDGSAFCYPENIAREMKRLFVDLQRRGRPANLSRDSFSMAAASFLATLNAIHPFREGNGRTQASFLALLAHRAGRPLELDRLAPDRFLAAMVESFRGSEQPLAEEIRRLIK